ncbi:CKLF-like MARVEL transmembrane domain-containing protein 7 isoform X1 [Mirounga leonina]|uniref:CKLF-like MARVEL transmembrane domain-containing protein 7 isoform X1 n=1 Tax=Mirounga leonina TaxID=9715 RepID=UPI00156C2779|nr:CKLF-like MARVEL transmembrane domain-containing protein 7 isoform X1 [Mirounga leonina]
MSHGAGLVRTTCSSGGGGPGAGAGQPGARPSEGLLDPVYPRTYSALLKVAQMVTLLIAFICVRSSVWVSYSAYSYFEVVTICNLIMILAFYLVHLFRLYRLLTCISWPLSELLHYLIGTLLLLIASIVAASKSYSQSGLVAGAVRTLSGEPSRMSSLLAHFLPDGQRGDCFLGPFFPRKVPIRTHLDPANSSLQRAGSTTEGLSRWMVGFLAHSDGAGGPALPQTATPYIRGPVGLNAHARSGHSLGAASGYAKILRPLWGPEKEHVIS